MLLIAKVRMEKWSTCAKFPCDPKEGDVNPEEVTKASLSKLDASGFEEKLGPKWICARVPTPASRKHHTFTSYRTLIYIASVRV